MSDEFQILKNKTGVLIYASVIEKEANAQIELMAEHPAFKELIAIMPDVHAGKGSVIGFTGKFKHSVVPYVIGVDIGCGVMTYELKAKGIDFAWFDKMVRENIPLGFNQRTGTNPTLAMMKLFSKAISFDDPAIVETCESAAEFLHLYCPQKNEDPLKPYRQMASLGSGNHFIEIEKSVDTLDERLYLTVHSGSRNFGLQVATHYQNQAKALMQEMNLQVPTDMEYLPMSSGGREYLKMMALAQEYAHYNRLGMINIILQNLKEEFDPARLTESVHNYISEKDSIVRKGAISAHKGEKVVIPLNMGEGIILGTGKGNPRYNYSAPHGAGRLYGRQDLFRKLKAGTGLFTMENYINSMLGIYTTSVCDKTFDEAPLAYKPFESLMPFLGETIAIDSVAKPVYNLKASEEGQ